MEGSQQDFADEMGNSISSWFDWIPSWMFNYSSFEETENEDLSSLGVVAAYNLVVAFLLWLYWTCECLERGLLT